jgi:hypothetical protein
MALWLQYLIAAIALLVLAPLIAWLGRRLGSRAKGGLMLASIMLGFGEVLDPPSKRSTKAAESVKGPAETDEPI